MNRVGLVVGIGVGGYVRSLYRLPDAPRDGGELATTNCSPMLVHREGLV